MRVEGRAGTNDVRRIDRRHLPLPLPPDLPRAREASPARCARDLRNARDNRSVDVCGVGHTRSCAG